MRARLAQRLEHRICNAMVIGSIPIAGFYLFALFFTLQKISACNQEILKILRTPFSKDG